MSNETEKAFICDVKSAYQDAQEVPEWEKDYLSTLIHELDKVRTLEDKVNCLLMNGVRYIGEGSYWHDLEEEFPRFVNATVQNKDYKE